MGTSRTARSEALRLIRPAVFLTGLAFAAAAVGHAPIGAAQASAVVTADRAPPPARYERVPPPRVGFLWAPGYWRWNAPARQFLWVGGYWEQRRDGQRYEPERWVQQDSTWHLQPGHWVR